MAAEAFFRDFALPSHHQDRLAHERFLLDTYADRRAPPRPALGARMLRAVLPRFAHKAP